MNIQESLQISIQEALQALYSVSLPLEEIALQSTKKEFEGSFTFVTFSLAKISKKNPELTAQEIGEYLVKNNELIEGFNVVKGFLNLVIKGQAWLALFNEIYANDQFGTYKPNGQKVIVEYSSPNTNKPLHLGHLRNNFLGYAVAQILKANGYHVDMVNLVNDRGIHICKSMVAYLKMGNGETPEQAGIKGDHLAGKYYVLFDKAYKEEIAQLMASGKTEEEAKKQAPLILEAQEMLLKWEANDPATVDLWKKMNGWVYEGFDATYKSMGVSFDKFYYESDTYLLGKDIVEEGLSKGVFFKKENNSVWADLSAEGLDEKLVLRGDGTSVYITQDLGTADLKYSDFGFDKSVYVVGNEQDYHFDVLFKILKKLGRPYADGLYHLSYGMVDLPSGKMKSREGTVVDADDLIQEMIDTAAKQTEELGKIEGFTPEQAAELYRTLGLGALKYFLLKVDPKKRMLFNPQESIEFQGNTGPFIQYTHARISAILRKAQQIDAAGDFSQLGNINPVEQEVIAMLSLYPAKIKEAAEAYAPSIIANYVYDLAKEYNRFYAEVAIFNEQDSQALAFRIALSQKVAQTIQKGMRLLGINSPERM